MTFKVRFLTIIFIGFVLSCSTGPEFERTNPYDRNPLLDSLDLNKFPPSGQFYQFTSKGLRFDLDNLFDPRGVRGTRDIQIKRMNGENDFLFIRNKPINFFDPFYIDESIIKREDIGFPLKYKFTQLNTDGKESDKTIMININFGSLEPVYFTEKSENELEISWAEGFFLNDGVIITQRKPPFSVLDISKPDSTATLIRTEENIDNVYEITPYKYFKDQKTLSDSLIIDPIKPLPPSKIAYEIISPTKVKITWKDNSYNETNYYIFEKNVLIDVLPANSESYIIEKTLEPKQTLNYKIQNSIGEYYSDRVPLEITIPDFELPRITGIDHLDTNKFRLNFNDENVSFERKVTFTIHGLTKSTVINKSGFIEIDLGYIAQEHFDVSFSSQLSSKERWFPISYRPSLDIIHEIELPINLDYSSFDINKSGNFISTVSFNKLYTISLEENPLEVISQLEFTVKPKFVRTSSDNNFILLVNPDNRIILINTSNYSIETETYLNNITAVYDAIFIPNTTSLGIAFSTNLGVINYDIESETYTSTAFQSANELTFFGGAEDERVLAIDKGSGKLFAFNTLGDFTFKSESDIDIRSINRGSLNSKVVNISHYNTSNNIVSFDDGYSYSIDLFSCGNFVCTDFLIPKFGDRNSISRSTALGGNYFFISSPKSISLSNKRNFGTLTHGLNHNHDSIDYLKLNKKHNIVVQISSSSNYSGKLLTLYDVSKKWKITNYGYEDYLDIIDSN